MDRTTLAALRRARRAYEIAHDTSRPRVVHQAARQLATVARAAMFAAMMEA